MYQIRAYSNYFKMNNATLNISPVLNSLLSQYKISEAELARKINVPRATINRLAAGRTPDPRASTLNAIAEFFGISMDQLLGKKPPSIETSQATENVNISTLLPIISFEDISHWQGKINEIDHTSSIEYASIGRELSKSVFALKLQGESMWPQFQENTLLIVDPERSPKNQDFVIVHIAATRDTLFRKLLIEGSYKFLLAINQTFPKINLTCADKILGVVIQTVRNL